LARFLLVAPVMRTVGWLLVAAAVAALGCDRPAPREAANARVIVEPGAAARLALRFEARAPRPVLSPEEAALRRAAHAGAAR
jgi:hypothetical protein